MQKKQKAQIFSLDFIIAAGLVVLAIGMTINYYDIASITGKEARIKNEMTLIATNAATILLEANPCNLENEFKEQGYKMAGCSIINNQPDNANTKAKLLIPETFNCSIKKNGTTNLNITGCNSDPPTSEIDIVAIDRNFTTINNFEIKKNEYEECIENGCSGIYSDEGNWITVSIWK
jgi:uncharacterized protein (UPF0333 family)